MNFMQILTPDDDLEKMDRTKCSIFLGGTMSPWREEVIELLSAQGMDIIILDPTVKDWEERIGDEDADNPAFTKQTDWEHLGIIMADIEVFFYDDTSVAPITLFEMGMYKTKESIIHLSDGYEKAGYIKYVSRRFGLPVVKSVKELAQLIMIRCKISHLEA
jgi:hypothetical protein